MRFLVVPRSWQLGVALGLSVGVGVVIIGAVRNGLSAPLFVLGVVLVAVFGGFAAIGPFVGGRPHLD
jgi:hypothetical protein